MLNIAKIFLLLSVFCLTGCTGDISSAETNAQSLEEVSKTSDDITSKSEVEKSSDISNDPYFRIFEDYILKLSGPRQDSWPIDFVLNPLADGSDLWHLEHIRFSGVDIRYPESTALGKKILAEFLQYLVDENIIKLEKQIGPQIYHIKIVNKSVFNEYIREDKSRLKVSWDFITQLDAENSDLKRVQSNIDKQNSIWLSIPLYNYTNKAYLINSLEKDFTDANCLQATSIVYKKYILSAENPIAQGFIGAHNVIKYRECSVYRHGWSGGFDNGGNYYIFDRDIVEFTSK